VAGSTVVRILFKKFLDLDPDPKFQNLMVTSLSKGKFFTKIRSVVFT